MNIQLGNLELKDVVEKEYLQKIQEFLDTNGYKRENTCNNIENELGNYHIFDIPRQIVICGREKMEDFIKFLQTENIVAKGFKERIGLTYSNKK